MIRMDWRKIKQYSKKFPCPPPWTVTDFSSTPPPSIFFTYVSNPPALSPVSFYEKQLQLPKDIEKKTEKPLNNIIHVRNQLRKWYYPAASENAEDRRRGERRKISVNPRRENKKHW